MNPSGELQQHTSNYLDIWKMIPQSLVGHRVPKRDRDKKETSDLEPKNKRQGGGGGESEREREYRLQTHATGLTLSADIT